MGRINLLEKRIRPDIAYTTHQCALFSHDIRASRRDAIIHLVNDLKVNSTRLITLDPDRNNIFEIYSNTNFCGNWHGPTSGNNPIIAKSHTGYVSLYTVFPIIWYIKLQTNITLSTMD